MTAETFEIALKSNVAAVAAKDAAALDALLASGKKVNDGLLIGNLGKSETLAQIKAQSAELQQQAALSAKLAVFDADRARQAAATRAELKKLTDDATGKTAESAAKAAAKEEATAAKAKAKADADALKTAEKIAKVQEKATKDRLAAAQKEDGWIKQNLKPNAFAGVVSQVEKIFGPKAAEGLVKGATFLADAGPGLAVAGGVVAAGGALVLAAAAALAVGAGKLIFAAVQYGVEQTAAAEKQKAILDKLTGGRGAVTFDLALSLAGETGQTPEVAIERVKQLMAAKFSTAEIPLLIKASADLGAVKGDEKGKALLEKLEMIANKGKVGQESLDGLSEAGVNATAVLEKLRKKGESLDAVRLRLKAGTIGAKEFAKAVGEAVEQDFGGIAGKGLDASLNRARISFSKLFTGLNLSPLTGAIDKVAKVLDGPAGEKLKTAFSHLGDAAIKTLFGPFEGAEGQKRLEKIATTLAVIVEKTATILEKSAPIIEKALDLLFDTGKKDPSGLSAIIDVLIGLGMAAQGLTLLDFDEIAAGFDRITAAIAGLLGVDISPATSLGTGIVDGMIGGILSGAAGVVSAIQTVAGDAITAAKSTLGIASPSKVFAEIGGYTSLGFAKGANDNASAASDATASMASDATGSATGAAAGGSGGGASGGRPISISISVTASGSGSADAQATAIASALEPQVMAIMRKVQRNQGEQGASLTTRAA